MKTCSYPNITAKKCQAVWLPSYETNKKAQMKINTFSYISGKMEWNTISWLTHSNKKYSQVIFNLKSAFIYWQQYRGFVSRMAVRRSRSTAKKTQSVVLCPRYHLLEIWTNLRTKDTSPGPGGCCHHASGKKQKQYTGCGLSEAGTQKASLLGTTSGGRPFCPLFKSQAVGY